MTVRVGQKAPDFNAPACYRGKFTNVKLACTLQNPALSNASTGGLSKSVYVPASNGQVARTVTVPFYATLDSVKLRSYPSASYQCTLTGFSASQKLTSTFSDSHASAAFRLSPTPAVLKGAFNW